MIPLLVVGFAGLSVAGYAIRQIRNLRRQLERGNAHAFTEQQRRATMWHKLCADCRQTVAGWKL